MLAILAILVLFVEFGLLSLFQNSPVAVSEIPAEWVITAILIFSVVYIFAIDKSKKLQSVKMPLLCGYIVRTFIVFWEIYGRAIYRIPYSSGDANGFYNTAVAIAQGEDRGYGVPFTSIIGKMFSFIGISRLWGQFLIMLCSIAAIHVAAMVLNRVVADEKAKKKSLWVLCLLPNFLFLSCTFLRESVITMCMAISLYCFVVWFQKKNELFFLAAFVFVFCGARFHAGVVGLAVGYIVVRVLYDNKKQQMNISAKGIIFAVLFLFVFVFLYNNYSDTLFGKVEGVEEISDIAQSGYRGGSDYSKYVGNSNNPVNLIIYTPVRIVFYLFSPFPWQWRNLTDVIAFLGSSMFYMWTVICAIRYLKNTRDNDKPLVIVLLILVICSVFVFAWGASNTGNAIRHRDKLVALYLVLYAMASDKKQCSKKLCAAQTIK